MKNVLRILLKRLKSKSPKLFKGIAIGAGIIGAACVAAPLLPVSLPAVVVSAIPLIKSACGTAIAVSVLTVED